eukprot:COSAG04_NODE_864_length_9792_cov_22.506035_8_plen_118_part_00
MFRLTVALWWWWQVARHTFKAVKPLVARQWIRQLNAQVDKYKAMSPAERGDDAAGGDHEEEHEHDITHPPQATTNIPSRPSGKRSLIPKHRAVAKGTVLLLSLAFVPAVLVIPNRDG